MTKRKKLAKDMKRECFNSPFFHELTSSRMMAAMEKERGRGGEEERNTHTHTHTPRTHTHHLFLTERSALSCLGMGAEWKDGVGAWSRSQYISASA
jgi:hypothetical protein